MLVYKIQCKNGKILVNNHSIQNTADLLRYIAKRYEVDIEYAFTTDEEVTMKTYTIEFKNCKISINNKYIENSFELFDDIFKEYKDKDNDIYLEHLSAFVIYGIFILSKGNLEKTIFIKFHDYCRYLAKPKRLHSRIKKDIKRFHKIMKKFVKECNKASYEFIINIRE